MDPRLWIYLDNLRLGYLPSTNLYDEQLEWAEAKAREQGFVCDAIKKDRLTRKGEIALRLSLRDDQLPVKP